MYKLAWEETELIPCTQRTKVAHNFAIHRCGVVDKAAQKETTCACFLLCVVKQLMVRNGPRPRIHCLHTKRSVLDLSSIWYTTHTDFYWLADPSGSITFYISLG
ncbi:unnamed protein product [Ectocarpus sp. 4 AP-2014]